MSVPKGDRGEADTEFLRTARELQVFTIRAVTKFPKRYTFYMSQPMAQMAGRAYEYVVCANSIFPSRKSDYELRRNYLLMARSELRALVSQIEIAIEMFGVGLCSDTGDPDGHKAERWMELVSTELRLVSGLIKRDSERFGSLTK